MHLVHCLVGLFRRLTEWSFYNLALHRPTHSSYFCDLGNWNFYNFEKQEYMIFFKHCFLGETIHINYQIADRSSPICSSLESTYLCVCCCRSPDAANGPKRTLQFKRLMRRRMRRRRGGRRRWSRMWIMLTMRNYYYVFSEDCHLGALQKLLSGFCPLRGGGTPPFR